MLEKRRFCRYFGESLSDRMAAEAAAMPKTEEGEAAAAVPIGLIQSAFGGTCIESWLR